MCVFRMIVRICNYEMPCTPEAVDSLMKVRQSTALLCMLPVCICIWEIIF